MLSEQQQRIMGYFIEEAKDHLNTIEQGLLNLQSTIADPEMAHEVFRAAHSVKGGAAMLGLDGIQHTSHRLEDYFKVLKECPVQVDQRLESLLLNVFDTLRDLLDQLQGPFGLTDDKAQEAMVAIEPTFAELNAHISQLVTQAGVTPPDDVNLQAVPPTPVVAAAPVVATAPEAEESAFQLIFQSDVPARLRDMLQLFKQPDRPEIRQQLDNMCQSLAQAGEQFELVPWVDLLNLTRRAIAHPDNDFRALAPVVIREIKHAQEQTLAGQSMAISAGDALLALVPPEPEPELADLESFDFLADDVEEVGSFDLPELGFGVDEALLLDETDEDLFGSEQVAAEADFDFANFSPVEEGTLVQEDAFAGLNLNAEFNPEELSMAAEDGPVVGAAELNSLADLFEADAPELTMTWQEEEILSDIDAGMPEPLEMDMSGDFSDLLQAGLDGNVSSPSENGFSLDDEDLSELVRQAEASSQESDLGLGDLTDDNLLPELQDVSGDSPFDILGDSPSSDENQMMGELNLFFSDIQDDSLEQANALDLPSLEDEESANFLFEDASEPVVITDLPGMDDPFGGISISSFALDEDEEPVDTASENPLQEPDLTDLTLPSEMEAISLGASESPFDFPDFDLEVVDASTNPFEESLSATIASPEAGDEFSELILEDSADGGSMSDSDDSETAVSWLDMLDSDEQIEELPVAPPLWSLDDDDVTADLWEDPAARESLSAMTPADSEPLSLETPQEFIGETAVPVDDVAIAFDSPSAADDLGFSLELPTDLSDDSLESLDLDLDSLMSSTTEDVSAAGEMADSDLGLDLNFDGLAIDSASGDVSGAAVDQDLNLDLDFGGLDSSMDIAPDLGDSSENLAAQDLDLDFDFAGLADGLALGSETEENASEASTEQDLLLGLDSTDDTDGLDAAFDLGGMSDIQETDSLSDEFFLGAEDSLSDSSGIGLDFDLEGALDDFSGNASADTDLPDNALSDSGDLDSLLDESALGFDLEMSAEEATSADFNNLLDTSELDFDLNLDTESSNAEFTTSDDDLDSLFGESGLDLTSDDLSASEDNALEQSDDLMGEAELGLNLDDSSEPEPTMAGDFGNLDSLLDEDEADLGLDFDLAAAMDSPLDLGLEALGDDDSEEMTDAAFAELSFDDDFVGDVSPTLIPEDEAASDVEATGTSLDLDVDLFLSETGFDLSSETEGSVTESMGGDDFGDLDALLEEASLEPPNLTVAEPVADSNDFSDLEALLGDTPPDATATSSAMEGDDFADLEALLDGGSAPSPGSNPSDGDSISSLPGDEFDDLEKLLEAADNTLGGPPSVRGVRSPAIANRRPAATRTSGMRGDQTMRVSVKNLDNLNNLIGELVVNRNSLEQAEERLRQFLDNLQYQVQQLSDVGQRMRDLYERSLLESSLMSSRKSYQMAGIPTSGTASAQSHATGVSFDALEMDRFTGFHTLSQEMIELIVRVRESASDIDFVVGETDQVTRNFRQITSQLQESLTRARMVPFAQTADRLPRAVRDISLRCGKQAELTIEGRETLIDKMILEQLYDPMTHLVNNAITHGIETPDERTSQGKAPTGRITVRAFHQGNQTVIAVSDDGAGIDPDRVKQKAIERRLITPEQARMMNRLDVYDLLFHHGFSTRDRADDFAGRGVGMDVVRTSLNDIRGVINIDSTVGRGTTFTIRLPLTLSVSKALCCISNRARIAFPMDGVEDMLDVPRDQIQTNNEGQACIQWRDQLLPFQALADLLKFNRSLGRGSVYGGNQEEDIISVVVLRSNAGSYLALQVDQVLGEQEIVIKQLEGPVPKPVGIAGATVLGDGRIMPIADVLELIDLSMGRIRREAGTPFWDAGADQAPPEPVSEVKTEPTVLIVDDSITVRELLSMTFNKVGYRVEQARDGQEAWEKLRSGLPCELVFCDIEMPRMDGLELLSRLQKDPHLGRIPIAMLTSRGADRHRQMAIQLGAKGYFTKPYLEEVLLDAAQRMLKGEILVEGANNDTNES